MADFVTERHSLLCMVVLGKTHVGERSHSPFWVFFWMPKLYMFVQISISAFLKHT